MSFGHKKQSKSALINIYEHRLRAIQQALQYLLYFFSLFLLLLGFSETHWQKAFAHISSCVTQETYDQYWNYFFAHTGKIFRQSITYHLC